jgi:hypothetical protein
LREEVIIVNKTVSPVLVGRRGERGEFNVLGDILGTCFSIGGGFCITAGHVVRELKARSIEATPLIATPNDNAWAAFAIQESEVLGADIGILKCPAINELIPALKWDVENIKVLAGVQSFGYAYGTHIVDRERMMIARAFKGEVVCTFPRFKPVGFEGAAFSVHELSFQAPLGLSGAPLLREGASGIVKGVVIGNSQSEMILSFETEKESDGEQSHSVERVERLTLGIAVRSIEIVALLSNLLEGTVKDHLNINLAIKYQLILLSNSPQI